MPACLIYIRLRTGVSGTVGNQHIGFSLQKTSATEFMCTQYLPLGSDVVVNLAQNLGQLLMVCVYMVYRITNILSYIWISTAPGIECRWPSIDKKPLFLHSTCVIGMLSQFCLGIAQIVSTNFSTINIKSAIIANRQPISMSPNILQRSEKSWQHLKRS